MRIRLLQYNAIAWLSTQADTAYGMYLSRSEQLNALSNVPSPTRHVVNASSGIPTLDNDVVAISIKFLTRDNIFRVKLSADVVLALTHNVSDVLS